MRKALPVAAALVLALAGCSAPSSTTEETEKQPEVVEEAATEEAAADQGVSIDWTEAKTGEEAAKGAGFDKFGVVTKFKLGDLEFSDPKFAYAGGVAQATYETPATAVYFRKGVDTYTTPLSDRNLDEFGAHWHKVIEGTDVTCYGPAKGAVTVATWTDGVKSYAVTFQGLGGDEMSMDTDELASLVKGFNEANADKDVEAEAKKAEEEKKKVEEEAKKAEEEAKKAQEEAKKAEEEAKKAQEQSSQSSSLISQANAEALVEKTCGGTCLTIDLVTTKQYGQCWYATAEDDNGNWFEYYVNNDGIYLIDEKGAQKEQGTPDKGSEEHYEGESVTIYDSIYAEWHKANDGQWYATFVTYNGTQIFAKRAPAGGEWAFWAIDGGGMVQVIYADIESSEQGEYGPAGVSSHWQSLDGSKWY